MRARSSWAKLVDFSWSTIYKYYLEGFGLSGTHLSDVDEVGVAEFSAFGEAEFESLDDALPIGDRGGFRGVEEVAEDGHDEPEDKPGAWERGGVEGLVEGELDWDGG